MKVIKELSYILTRNKTRSIEIIGDDAMRSNTKLSHLYEIIQKDEIKTDAEAAYLIYGEKKVTAKYRSLKSSLKKRLYNTLFFININEQTGERELAYHNCWKTWAVNRIASKNSALKASESIALKAFKVALKYEFSDLMIVISLYLRNYYSLIGKKVKEFDYYNKYYYDYHHIAYYENLADEYYQRLILDHTLKSIIANPQIKSDAEKYFTKLKEVASTVPTIKFQYRMYGIRILGYMGVFDYQNTKKTVEKAIKKLKGHPNLSNSMMRNFLLHKLVCHVQLKEFEEGKTTANECKKLLKAGSFNWFKAQEYFFMLSMQTGNYQEAYQTEFTISKHKRFKSLPPYIQETWLLYYAYLHFLVKADSITPLQDDQRFSTFRLSKFLNNIPLLSKDKRGMNIPILIIQSAFLILQKKYDEAIDRIEAIDKYRIRYVKKDDPNYRSNIFVKMMQEIPKGGFNASVIAEKSKKYLKHLKEVPFDFTIQPHEAEVLPFEIMWDWMLDRMRKNRIM